MSNATDLMTGVTRIALKYPFALNGQNITTLEMRRPKVKDLRKSARYGASDAEREVGLLSVLVGCTPEDLDEMDAADYGQLQGMFRRMAESDAEPHVDGGHVGADVQNATIGD